MINLQNPSPRTPSQNSRRQLPSSDEEEEEDDDDKDDDNGEHPEPFLGQMTGPGDCERLYRSLNNCPKTFGSMATGLTTLDQKQMLSDFEDDACYEQMPSKKNFKPTREFSQKEMIRRARKSGPNMKKFKKRSLTRQQCLHWLAHNPVTDPVDVAFLVKEEGILYNVMVDAAHKAEQAKGEKLLTSNWTGNFPWLRLCCAVCEDDCQQALADWNRSLNRQELDARNNDARPMTYWQKVCLKHNNPDWEVLTDALPELHTDFSESILLKLNDMPERPLASPEDARKKGAEARAKLMQVK